MFAISMPVQEHGEVENGTRRRGVVQGLVAEALALGRHYSRTTAELGQHPGSTTAVQGLCWVQYYSSAKAVLVHR